MSKMIRIIILASVLLLIIVLINFIDFDSGENYGKVTCSTTGPVPDFALITTFVASGNAIPSATPTEQEIGAMVRNVFIFTEAFTPPKTLNEGKALSVLKSGLPMDHHASMTEAFNDCINRFGKELMDEETDKTGKTWVKLSLCAADWGSSNLCKKELSK